MNECRIERLSDSNFAVFHQLFCKVYKTIPLAILYQKYQSPNLLISQRYLGYMALDSNSKAVAYFGGIPFSIQYRDEKYIGVQVCDVMTLRAYRKRGLFNQLGTKTFDLCQSLNIPFVFAFPNQMSKPLFVEHFDWKIKNTLLFFEIPIKTIPLSAIAKRITLITHFYDKWVSTKIVKYESSQMINRHKNGVFRNDAFYNYKKHSYILDFNYGKVWLKINACLVIGDIELKSDSHFLELIKELKSFARWLGIHKILFGGTVNMTITQHFMKHYSVVGEMGVGFKSFVDDLDISQCYFTYGDFDTF